MIDAELLVPTEFGPTLTAYSPVRETQITDGNGIQWRGYRLTTNTSTNPHVGIEPLRKVVVPAMGEILLSGINVVVSRILSIEEEQLPIRYRVSSHQVNVGPITRPMSQLASRG